MSRSNLSVTCLVLGLFETPADRTKLVWRPSGINLEKITLDWVSLGICKISLSDLSDTKDTSLKWLILEKSDLADIRRKSVSSNIKPKFVLADIRPNETEVDFGQN